MRHYGYYSSDPQDVSPAFVDDEGVEVYHGELYYETEDGAVFSEESWRRLKRSLMDCGIEIEGRVCYA